MQIGEVILLRSPIRLHRLKGGGPVLSDSRKLIAAVVRKRNAAWRMRRCGKSPAPLIFAPIHYSVSPCHTELSIVEDGDPWFYWRRLPRTSIGLIGTNAIRWRLALTAPGTAGTTFPLVQTDAAGAFPKGQLYFTAVGAAARSQCLSNTTGSSGGSITYGVTGGTGIFTGASGSLLLKFNSQTLAAPGTPPGSNGVFGAGQFTLSGSLTK